MKKQRATTKGSEPADRREGVKQKLAQMLGNLIACDLIYGFASQRMEVIADDEDVVTVIEHGEYDTTIWTLWLDSILCDDAKWDCCKLPKGTQIVLPTRQSAPDKGST